MAALRPRDQAESEAVATTIGRLVNDRRFERAWQIFASVRNDAQRVALQSGVADQLGENATPFDWVRSSQVAGSVAIISAEGGVNLSFSATGGGSGSAVRRLLVLPPGRFAIDGMVQRQPQGGSAALELISACDDTEIARIPLAPDRPGRRSFSGNFKINTGCSGQWLALNLDQDDKMQSIEGEVILQLRPITS